MVILGMAGSRSDTMDGLSRLLRRKRKDFGRSAVLLWGHHGRRRDSRQCQHIHSSCTGAHERPRCRFGCRSRGDHIVEQDDPLPLDMAAAAPRDEKGASQVLAARDTCQRHLRFGLANLRKCVRTPGDTGELGQLASKQRRLIELTANQPPAGKRHRYDPVRIHQHVAPRIRQPVREHAAPVVPVCILHGVNEARQHATALVDGDCPRTSPYWRVGSGCSRDLRPFSSQTKWQRNAQSIAKWWPDERDIAPALPAKRVLPIESRMTGEANRRNDHVRQAAP